MSIASRRTSTSIHSATGTRMAVLKGPNTSKNPNHWNGASTSSFNTTDITALTKNQKRNQIYQCSINSKLISLKKKLFVLLLSIDVVTLWILESNKHLSLINSFQFHPKFSQFEIIAEMYSYEILDITLLYRKLYII